MVFCLIVEILQNYKRYDFSGIIRCYTINFIVTHAQMILEEKVLHIYSRTDYYIVFQVI